MKFGTKTHLLCFAINLFGVIAAGWVVRDLWLWFLVPLGAPSVPLIVAAGIFRLARMPSKDLSPSVILLLGAERDLEATSKQKSFYVMYQVVTEVLIPAGTWLCGCALHWLSSR